MMMPEEDLPQVPADIRPRRAAAPIVAAAPQKKTGAPPHRGNSHLAVFSNLMVALIESVRRLRKFDEFVAALQLQQPKLSQATLSARAVWIQGALANPQQFAGNVPQSERRSVLMDLYFALRDACGRGDADAVLAIAVRASEQVSDSQRSTWQQLSQS